VSTGHSGLMKFLEWTDLNHEGPQDSLSPRRELTLDVSNANARCQPITIPRHVLHVHTYRLKQIKHLKEGRFKTDTTDV